MKPRKKKIALLFGGRSAEHEVSLISARAIYKNIDKRKYRVLSFYINKKGAWKKVKSPLLLPKQLAKGPSFSFLPWQGAFPRRQRADIYFPILHGPYGEDGTIQGLLEMADAPYVGAGVLASAAGMDKAVMKALFAAKNLPLVKHRTIIDSEYTKNK